MTSLRRSSRSLVLCEAYSGAQIWFYWCKH